MNLKLFTSIIYDLRLDHLTNPLWYEGTRVFEISRNERTEFLRLVYVLFET